MSQCQILPPSPTIADSMDNVSHTSCNSLESAFNFETWQEAPQHGLLQLLLCSPLQATTAGSTDSSLEEVIHSLPLQLQSKRRKGNATAQSLEPTPSNTEF